MAFTTIPKTLSQFSESWPLTYNSLIRLSSQLKIEKRGIRVIYEEVNNGVCEESFLDWHFVKQMEAGHEAIEKLKHL